MRVALSDQANETGPESLSASARCASFVDWNFSRGARSVRLSAFQHLLKSLARHLPSRLEWTSRTSPRRASGAVALLRSRNSASCLRRRDSRRPKRRGNRSNRKRPRSAGTARPVVGACEKASIRPLAISMEGLGSHTPLPSNVIKKQPNGMFAHLRPSRGHSNQASSSGQRQLRQTEVQCRVA